MNRIYAAMLVCLALASPALAHTGAGTHVGFTDGFVHPLLGLDHLLAMLGIGVWAAVGGGSARWLWPLAFVAAMTAAATLAITGMALPHFEILILTSVVGIGAAVALELRPSLIAGAAICAAFAVSHGAAHGAELPTGASAIGYVAGFVATTGCLHALGVGAGLWLLRSKVPARTTGAVIAAIGATLAFT